MKRWQKIILSVVLIIKLLIVTVTLGFAGDEYIQTWSAVAASTANAESSTCTVNGGTATADCAINVEGASMIQVQWDTSLSANVSTDIDINILISNDCRKFQNGTTATTGIYYEQTAIGDGVVGAIRGGLTPAGKCIKVRIDNDDGVNAATIEISVYVVR